MSSNALQTNKTAPVVNGIDVLITPVMRAALEPLRHPEPLLAGMGEYHLGWVDSAFAPVEEGSIDRGKRIRPLIAVLCCEAAGGDAAIAAPLAAALELLHNFTLIHDDIQDHSPTRRHRPTVWARWGNAQAINAGDALFAAAHLALLDLRQRDVAAEQVLDLVDAFDRMTIEIVAGQVQDLAFESRTDVTPDDYLRMIAGKTSAIVAYAAWAGSLLGGATAAGAEQFRAFGLALGLGFQIQDDLLGIWGTVAETGKAAADDIRRRKQSYPILLLRAAVEDAERQELDRRYEQPEIDPEGIAFVLGLLDRHQIRAKVADRVRLHHDEAQAALRLAAPDDSPARQYLLAMIEALAFRSS